MDFAALLTSNWREARAQLDAEVARTRGGGASFLSCAAALNRRNLFEHYFVQMEEYEANKQKKSEPIVVVAVAREGVGSAHTSTVGRKTLPSLHQWRLSSREDNNEEEEESEGALDLESASESDGESESESENNGALPGGARRVGNKAPRTLVAPPSPEMYRVSCKAPRQVLFGAPRALASPQPLPRLAAAAAAPLEHADPLERSLASLAATCALALRPCLEKFTTQHEDNVHVASLIRHITYRAPPNAYYVYGCWLRLKTGLSLFHLLDETAATTYSSPNAFLKAANALTVARTGLPPRTGESNAPTIVEFYDVYEQEWYALRYATNWPNKMTASTTCDAMPRFDAAKQDARCQPQPLADAFGKYNTHNVSFIGRTHQLFAASANVVLDRTVVDDNVDEDDVDVDVVLPGEEEAPPPVGVPPILIFPSRMSAPLPTSPRSIRRTLTLADAPPIPMSPRSARKSRELARLWDEGIGKYDEIDYLKRSNTSAKRAKQDKITEFVQAL